MRSAEREEVNVQEMKCLRSLVGVSRMDRVRNDGVRRGAGIEMELAGTRETEVRLDGWCEGSLGQLRNDGGGWASIRERSERVGEPCLVHL